MSNEPGLKEFLVSSPGTVAQPSRALEVDDEQLVQRYLTLLDTECYLKL